MRTQRNVGKKKSKVDKSQYGSEDVRESEDRAINKEEMGMRIRRKQR